ncbi:MAG: tetratricopeptide repeat protein [Bacteroidia bacterium]|nr:tetratricopeptide repeat protein [Bacteroidia bacterium]
MEKKQFQLQLPHYLLILIGAALMLLLALTEKKAALHKPENSTVSPSSRQILSSKKDLSTNLAPPNLPPELQQRINILEKATTLQDSLKILQEIVNVAISQDRYDVASNYQEQILLKYKDQEVNLLEKTARYFYEASLRADSLENTTFTQKALNYYEKYLSKKPQDLDAQVIQALLWVKGNTPMQGIQKLVKLAEENPGLYKAHLELGKFSLQTGQLDKAIMRLQQAQKVNSSDWEAHFYLGLALQQKEKGEEAQAAYRKAMSLAPTSQIKSIIEQQLHTISNN